MSFSYAQEDNSETAYQLDNVVVTAQRREQSLQDVPLAITVLSGDEIADRGAVDVLDLAALTPGATFTFINAAEPVISIRGISSGGEGAASDSGVLMMIDGEVISRDFLRGAPIFDVERLEVLRGPQGTTYGRNATGGVIHLISRTPTDTFQGNTSLEIGDYGLVTVESAVSGPLDEQTSARLAVQINQRDGYTTDYFTGRDVDTKQSAAGRLTLDRELSPNWNMRIRGNYSQERHGETGPQKSYDPSLPFISPPFVPQPFVEPTADPYQVGLPTGTYFDRDIWGASSELVWSSGALEFVSLTTFRHGDNEFRQTTPQGYNIIDGTNEADVFSQEFRLSGTSLEGDLFWVSGLYLIDEDVSFGFDRSGETIITPPTRQSLRQTSDSRGYGIFAEGAWTVTPPLTLTLGARYSRDEKSFSIFNQATGAFAPFFVDDPSMPVAATASDSWETPTYRASVEYQWTDDISTYFTYSRGYKSGGFNSEPANLVAATTTFDEEILDNFEAGLRSRLFSNRLILNLTAFDMHYEDIQTGFFTVGGVETIANIGAASISGIEAEFTARPFSFLTLSGNYAGYDHEYDEFSDSNGNDLSGTPVAKVPDWTLTLSARLETPAVGDHGRFGFELDHRTRSDVYHDAPPDPIWGVRPGVDILDARLNWTSNSGNWEASIWGRNLLDEAEMVYIGPQVILSQRPVVYGPPRTIGVRLSHKFGG